MMSFVPRFQRLTLVLSALGFWFSTSRALQAEEPLQVELVPSVSHVQPGQPFYVGLHLEHKKGYHTYWKFPGIVGVPTSMQWQLPAGWKADEIEWPEPAQVHMFQIRAQGYHDEVLLPIRITPPRDLIAGSKVTLKGKTSWMCCGRDCNPGFSELTLELPVAETEPKPAKKWAAKFAAAHAALPRAMEGWTATATRTKNQDVVTLKLTPKTAEAKARTIEEVLFFTDDGLINADKDQTLERQADGSLVLKLMISQYADKPLASRLDGVLQSPQGWSTQGARSVSIAVPISITKGS